MDENSLEAEEASLYNLHDFWAIVKNKYPIYTSISNLNYDAVSGIVLFLGLNLSFVKKCSIFQED